MKSEIICFVICVLAVTSARRIRPKGFGKLLSAGCRYGMPVVSACDDDNKFNMVINKIEGDETCQESIVARTGQCVPDGSGTLVPAQSVGGENCWYSLPDLTTPPACNPDSQTFTVQQKLLSGGDNCQNTLEKTIRCRTENGETVPQRRYPLRRRPINRINRLFRFRQSPQKTPARA